MLAHSTLLITKYQKHHNSQEKNITEPSPKSCSTRLEPYMPREYSARDNAPKSRNPRVVYLPPPPIHTRGHSLCLSLDWPFLLAHCNLARICMYIYIHAKGLAFSAPDRLLFDFPCFTSLPPACACVCPKDFLLPRLFCLSRSLYSDCSTRRMDLCVCIYDCIVYIRLEAGLVVVGDFYGRGDWSC